MPSDHVLFQLTINSEFVDQICPVARTRFRPNVLVVLCNQANTAISFEAWKEIILDQRPICPCCGRAPSFVSPQGTQETSSPQPQRRSSSTRSPQPPRSNGRSPRRTRSPEMQSSSSKFIRTHRIIKRFPKESMIVTTLFVCILISSAFCLVWVSGNQELAKEEPLPQSYFVSPVSNLQISVNQEVRIETYHRGNYKNLKTLEIFVDDQPLATFPKSFGTVQVLMGGRAIPNIPFKPDYSTIQWTVSIIWMSQVPGNHKLSLIVTDEDGNRGEPLVQRIEIK